MPKKTKQWFLLVLHLDRTSKVPEILELFTNIRLTGCTIMDTTGVGHSTFHGCDKPVIASMSRMFGPEKQYNKTILTVIEGKELLDKAIEGIEDIVGDFCKPDVGLMYAISIHKVTGYHVEMGEGERVDETT